MQEVWQLAVATSALLVVGDAAFVTPTSPPIPDAMQVPAVEVCTNNVVGMAYDPQWVPKYGTESRDSSQSTFSVVPYGLPFMYFKADTAFPKMQRGLEYEVSFDLKLVEANVASVPKLASAGLMVWKDGKKGWEKSGVWPTEYAKEKPQDVVGGREFAFTASGGSGGFTVYTTVFSPAEAVNLPKQKVWVHLNLVVRPAANAVSYILRNFCVRRVAKTVSPPPALASYTEKFVFVRPAQPSAAELTQQSGCPFEEAGLQTWESVFGTKTTGTLELPANAKVVVGAQSFVAGARYTKIVVPATSELIFRDEAVALTVKAVVVQGKLRIGSETCRMQGPIKMTFWGQRGDPATDLDGFGSKGLAVTGSGEVDMFGRRFFPTWVRLARQARAGDDRVYLQEAVNWYPGQEVAVLTTIPDDTGKGQPHQNEVMTVKAVGGAGRVVQFTAELAYNHYAGTEYQGEVALLSRHIMLEGEPDADGYGAHFVVAGKRGRVAGVASRYMGQTNIMARYPFHFHMMGVASDSYFSDNVARDTYFRCFTIHGTNGARVSENVAFNATGSCYYVEDGVEEDNTVSYNMAAHVHVIGKPAAGGAQSGEVVYQSRQPGGLRSGLLLQPADASATGFYFSNAYNSIVGNVASGGWSGFGFPGLPTPIERFKHHQVEPQSRPLKEFRGNTAHSTGWHWASGGAIYVGGVLSYTDRSKSQLKWMSGRDARNTRVEKEPGYQNWEGTPLWMRFENTLVYASNKGLLHWGNRVDIDGFEFHDVARSVTLFGDSWLGNGIVNAVSGNTDARSTARHHDGFQFYDISVKSLVTNVEFRNYQKSPCRWLRLPGQDNRIQPDRVCSPTGNVYANDVNIFTALYHSDEFKPQQISAVNKITYKNVDKDLLVGLKIVETGASRFFNFIDFDGSATMEGRPTIVGSHLDWWNVCSDCRFEAAWQTWLCPKKPANYEEREVAHIKVQTPDISPSNGGIGKTGNCKKGGRGDADWSNCNVGYMALWKRDANVRKTIITRNAGVTGITGTGWYMRLDGGAPKKFTLAPEQIPSHSTLRFATSYPRGTTFIVRAGWKWNKEYDRTLRPARSMAELEADPFGKYYTDGQTLFLRPKLPAGLTPACHTRGGATVCGSEPNFLITVVASCRPDRKGFCQQRPQARIPWWSGSCPAVPTAPAPAPQPRPASVCPSDTKGCGCDWAKNGAACGKDDGSMCYCKCCCRHKGTCSWKSRAPAPVPAPAPAPAPVTPEPRPASVCPSDTKGCGCDWAKNGAACGKDDGSMCYCKCCCRHKGTCNWKRRTPSRPAAARSSPSAAVCSGRRLDKWDSCKSRPKCCPSGTKCYKQTRWYAQCRPVGKCPSTWPCNVL